MNFDNCVHPWISFPKYSVFLNTPWFYCTYVLAMIDFCYAVYESAPQQCTTAVHHRSAVPTEAGRRQQIPWSITVLRFVHVVLYICSSSQFCFHCINVADFTQPCCWWAGEWFVVIWVFFAFLHFVCACVHAHALVPEYTLMRQICGHQKKALEILLSPPPCELWGSHSDCQVCKCLLPIEPFY